MLLTVKATPSASKTTIKRYENGILYVAVAAPAQDGEANNELIRFLAKTFGLQASAIKIITGSSARLKRVKIPLTEEQLKGIIQALGN